MIVRSNIQYISVLKNSCFSSKIYSRPLGLVNNMRSFQGFGVEQIKLSGANKRYFSHKCYDGRPILMEDIKTLMSHEIYYRALSYFENFKNPASSKKSRKTNKPSHISKKCMESLNLCFNLFLFVALVCDLFFF